jgi:molybdopterin-guanine dinucleotide biosynthesis protein A
MRAAGLGAILLAGGRATRMQGATKPLLDIGGRTLLARAVAAAVDSGAAPVTVAGPVLDAALPVAWVREDPPFAGPAAAIVAALESWPVETAPEWTLLLACDLPAAAAAVRRLTADVPLLPADSDGMCLADSSSRPQWLVGVYRTRALRAAASALPDAGRDAPVRALVDDLAITVVAVDDDLIHDVDTWEDLTRARSIHEGATMTSSRTLPPEALDAWAEALRTHFGLEADDLPVALILDLARDVATEVVRPAAPFSAFVAGLVAGRAGATPADTEAAVAAIRSLAKDWTA